MAEVKVPKPPKTAFNPRRKASDLLQWQVYHMEWAVRHAGERGPRMRGKKIVTEADAGNRMSALMSKIASAERLPFRATEPTAATAVPQTRKRKKAKKR